jgi:hypothetical protein
MEFLTNINFWFDTGYARSLDICNVVRDCIANCCDRNHLDLIHKRKFRDAQSCI